MPSPEEIPLHGNDGMYPGDWWGCDYPERQHDDHEVWDERCPNCILRMKLVVITEGDQEFFDARTEYLRSDTLAQRIARLENQ